MENAKLRRLVILNLAWSALLTLATVFLGGMWWIEQYTDPGEYVSVSPAPDGAGIFALIGGTTVTHLMTASEPWKIAWLPEPLLSIDSSDFQLSQAELDGLVWRDLGGTPVPPPPAGTALQAVFHESHFSAAPDMPAPPDAPDPTANPAPVNPQTP